MAIVSIPKPQSSVIEIAAQRFEQALSRELSGVRVELAESQKTLL